MDFSQSWDRTLIPKLEQLKEEKEKLESKLSQLQVRKKDVETKQENISKKNLQLDHRQDNMKRTVNVAKRKCEETNHHMERLQRNNDDLQQSIKQIKDGIRDREKEKDGLVTSHLDELRKLADKFRKAGQMYLDEKLNEELEKYQRICDTKKQQIVEKKGSLDLISVDLTRLSISEDGVCEEKPAVAATWWWSHVLQQKNELIAVFNSEKDVACASEQQMKLSVDALASS